MQLWFCAHCHSWSRRLHDACEYCELDLPILGHEPTPAELEQRVGVLEEFVSEIELVRPTPPRRGALLLTSQGLAFLPQLAGQHAILTCDEPTGRLWPPDASRWFLRRPVGAILPTFPPDNERASLQLSVPLLTLPGSWFMPIDQFQGLEFRWRRWSLRRQDRAETVFRIPKTAEGHSRLPQFSEQWNAAWLPASPPSTVSP